MDNALRTRIVRWHLPAAVKKFLDKNADYGSGHNEFGSRGQVIDIARKYKKLRAAIWDGQEMTQESVVEIAQDMIGHLLLLIDEVSEPRRFPNEMPFTGQCWHERYDEGMAALGHTHDHMAGTFRQTIPGEDGAPVDVSTLGG